MFSLVLLVLETAHQVLKGEWPRAPYPTDVDVLWIWSSYCTSVLGGGPSSVPLLPVSSFSLNWLFVCGFGCKINSI